MRVSKPELPEGQPERRRCEGRINGPTFVCLHCCQLSDGCNCFAAHYARFYELTGKDRQALRKAAQE